MRVQRSLHPHRGAALPGRVLELTALPSVKPEDWIPAVEETDALLVWGGSPLYLCYWMRQSGLADLLPSLRPETVYVGTSGGANGGDPRPRRRNLRRG